MRSQRVAKLLVGWVVLSLTSLVYADPVEVSIKLNPVGSYVAKTSQIEGVAIVTGDQVMASMIKVKTQTLKTGIALRDKHTIEHLQGDKHPEIILVKAEGKGGQGTGVIRIKGIEKPIKGTYKIEGQKLKASFSLSLKDFKIEKVKYMGVGVKDEVQVKVEVPIQKEK